MKFLQLSKGTKRTYFLYVLLGIGVFAVYFFIMVHWMEIMRGLLGKPYLGFDHQPIALKYLNKLCGHLLWIILGILFIRGIIKRNLVVPISIGFGFLLSYVGLLAYMFGSPVVKDYASRMPFDSSKWQNEELVNTRNPVRIRMVDDMLKKHNLVGMTKENLIALLGIPPKTGYFSNYDFVYWLGPERGFFSIDSEWLVIKLEDDKVVEAMVVRD